MNHSFFHSGKISKARRRIFFNRKVFTFSLFVAIASFLWFLNKLSNTYTTIIKYPVTFINLPSNKILANKPAEFIELKVTSYGFILIRYSLFQRNNQPIVIDLDNIHLKRIRNGEFNRYYIVAGSIKNSVESQINSEMKMLEIKPDTIFFNFSNYISKNIKVIPVLSYELVNQYMLKGKIMTIPESIQIKGLSPVIDTLQFLYTKPLKLGKIKKSLQKEVAVIAPEGIQIDQKKVKVEIPVDQFTETTLKVPIIVRNQPDSATLKLFPSFVTVNFNVPISEYKNIVPGILIFEINFPDSEGLKKDVIEVKPGTLPPFVQLKKYNPQYVQYLIEKK